MPLQAQGFKVSGLCKLQVSRFLAFSGPLEIQGFKVSGLCKFQVSRFLAFSGLLEIQGFKVSGLFRAFAGSRFQGFCLKFQSFWPFPGLWKQVASFKVSGLA